MERTITFRQAVKSDIPQLIDLMNLQYSRKKSEAYFLWQYFASAYPTILMCAFSGLQLTGMFGIQKRILDNGATAGQAIDMLVASDWRGEGIFRELGRKAAVCFQGLDLLCVLPNQNGKNACEKAFGWKTIGKINSMYMHREQFNNFSKKPLKDFSIDEKGQILNKFRYGREVRAWRFDRHPDYKYTYIKLITGEFAILKIFEDPVTGERSGDIVDLECALNNRKLLTELFLEAVNYLRKQDVKSINTWALPHTPLCQVLESLGFTEMPKERYFCLCVLNKTYEYLYNIKNWHLVQSDAEIY